MLSLWICFLGFILCYAGNFSGMWLVMSFWGAGISVYLLVKSRLPSGKYIILSFVLSAAASAAYLGYEAGFGMQIPLSFVLCFLSCLAVFSVMEKSGGYTFIKTKGSRAPFVSLLIGLASGTVLGVINLLLAGGSATRDVSLTFPRFLVSLNPGIYEEIVCRAVFMAFCAYLFKKRNAAPSRFELFTMWFMMTVPHCLTHGYPIVESMVLLVLFGLPFAYLQRKRDILSAMISHFAVDFIRFIVFGLPA